MGRKSTYCKCLNKYLVKGCPKKKCNVPDYWRQGIGITEKVKEE